MNNVRYELEQVLSRTVEKIHFIPEDKTMYVKIRKDAKKWYVRNKTYKFKNIEMHHWNEVNRLLDTKQAIGPYFHELRKNRKHFCMLSLFNVLTGIQRYK